jgi:hypothetical protein
MLIIRIRRSKPLDHRNNSLCRDMFSSCIILAKRSMALFSKYFTEYSIQMILLEVISPRPYNLCVLRNRQGSILNCSKWNGGIFSSDAGNRLPYFYCFGFKMRHSDDNIWNLSPKWCIIHRTFARFSRCRSTVLKGECNRVQVFGRNSPSAE